jgi:hypothetical protein
VLENSPAEILVDDQVCAVVWSSSAWQPTLETAESIAVSRDGRNLYVTPGRGSGAVAVFKRDAASGALV